MAGQQHRNDDWTGTAPVRFAAVTVITSKTANALIEDAEVNALGRLAAQTSSGSTRWIDRSRQRYGGLWVGGRLTLTTTTVEFHPNTANRSLQNGSLDVVLALRHVESVELMPGLVTKIVVVRTPDRVLSARCFGAAKLADQIRSAADAAHG
ncbi:hypothetical protein [Mycolicibacterium sp. HK-90]|uniref:hypothetical protein n=1 Tax=Mycolicibacterium sp. HK-90 TaxID=3056937 RepID=UPI00265979DE|nr:hypothetical protein [Mycolicibacterium sp. HK-90]WKG06205.1 hypothetical protein QU592_14495 [Mycolicibacterium sp. HK-90]